MNEGSVKQDIHGDIIIAETPYTHLVGFSLPIDKVYSFLCTLTLSYIYLLVYVAHIFVI